MDNGKANNAVSEFFTTKIPNFYKIIKDFIKNNFEITSTKNSKITGGSIAGVLLLLVVFFNNQFLKLEIGAKWLMFIFAALMPLLIGTLIAFSIKIKHELFDKIWHFVLFMLFPIVTMAMTECLNNVFIYNMTYLGFLANYVVILLFQFFFFAVSGSFRISLLATNAIAYGLSLAHCYVVLFRGTPFTPWDFYAITTAANVANTYSYTPTHTIIIASLIFILIVVIGIKLKTPKYNFITKIVSRTFMGAFFSIVMILFYCTNIFSKAGVNPDFWSQARGYKNYGFMFSFFCNTAFLGTPIPDRYSPEHVDKIISDTVDDEENNQPDEIKPTGNEPNIICIMNESLSDLSVLGEFTTNQDYMPFMRSLNENTIKGNLYVPVIGAGTSNTEFEFLTGHSTAFFRPGTNAYMLYVKNPIASLVSTLEGQGYSSWAFHPYYSTGWDRVPVYSNMGFNSFSFLENLMDSSILNEYKQNGSDADYLQSLVDTYYPERENMLIRQYISDSYNYDVIIENFENRDKSKPYFTFNVTMQNHGGYSNPANNFDECIEITSSPVYYNKASKYLSLIKASDDAFKGLIEYFQGVEEPTIICMFGDHQPSIETEFIASLLGADSVDDLSLEQEQARHITPFYIWANYDIEEKYIDKLSSNYLSSYVLEAAGVKLTKYNKYLLKLSKTLPVIDPVGYIDANNNYYAWGEKSEYSKLIDEYEEVQCNNIFDNEQRKNDVFFLDGYVMPEIIQKEDADE